MADLSVASVKLRSGEPGAGTAGVTITAGQGLYLDSADNRLKLAAAADVAKARCVGIALNGATADQPVNYAGPGSIVDLGGGTAGLIYIVSGTAGGLSPHSDATTPSSGENLTVVTVCKGSNLHRVVAYGAADAALA